MLEAMFVVLTLKCSPVQLIGFDKPITKSELESLTHASKRCSEIYPDAPCLKRFEKREEDVFWATCGDYPKKPIQNFTVSY